VKHYAIIAKHLTELLQKHQFLHWTNDQEVTFNTLKIALISAPILALPNFDKPFDVETDASDMGVGAVLMQDKHPLAFISKALGPKLRGLSTYEKEYVALLLIVEQWRPYLQLREFHIYTDQKSLSYLNEQRLHTAWQQKVFTKLLGLNYRIVYKKGVDNCVVDALSRKPSLTSCCLAISSCQPQWLAQLQQSYEGDPNTKDVITS
jgi:hypothetical protein